jgi:pimeloyl-ACP methyl ester carboxylesterase
MRAVERKTIVGDTVLRYRVAGEGDPLVLVHGLAGSWRWWAPALPALAARREVHLVDLPGFGSVRGGRFLLRDAPALVGALADELGLDTLDLAGHSLGGLISARLAAARPELVRRLVLVAPAGVHARSSMRAHLLPLAATALRARPRLNALIAADAVRAGPWTLWRAARDLLADDLRAELEGIRAPTLLVWGQRDALVPPALAAAFTGAIADARVVVLPGAAHVPMVERPQAFADAVLAFLDQ